MCYLTQERNLFMYIVSSSQDEVRYPIILRGKNANAEEIREAEKVNWEEGLVFCYDEHCRVCARACVCV